MRNLKRVLGLALASVMVLSMMVVGAGAANYDDFSDKDEIVNNEAVQMLVELGVINGKDDGSYGSDVTYVDKDATPAINTIVKTEGVEKVWDGTAAKTVTSDSLTKVTADVTLTAMYKVTVTGDNTDAVSATKADPTSITTEGYVAVGETVTITPNSGNEAKAEGTTGVTIEDGATSFIMPAGNVTITFDTEA